MSADHQLTYTAILPTDESAGYAAASDVLTFVLRAIGVVAVLDAVGARIKRAVERLNAGDPELEEAAVVTRVAAEGDLRRTVGEEREDAGICHHHPALRLQYNPNNQ